MSRDLERFYAACETLAAARGRFQRRVREGNAAEKPDDIPLLMRALNVATYSYFAAVEKLDKFDHAD